MITLLFDIYIAIVCLVIFRNIQVGFLITLISKILIPGVVRFDLGPISVAIYDVFTLALLFSFVISKSYKWKIQYPIARYFYIYVVSTFILIFFSSAYVPYGYQLYSFAKSFLFQTILYIWIGFHVFRNFKLNKVISILCIVSLFAGIYGIYGYITSSNPYIILLNLLYGNESDFSFFLEESRGGLHGRTYGTMGHPLAWGQFWNIFLCLLWIYRRTVNKYLAVVVFSIGIINIVLCGSRTALVTLFVFCIFILLSYGIKKLLLIIPSAYLLLSVILMALPQEIKRSDMVSYIESGLFFWDSSYSEKAGIVGSSTEMRYTQLQKTVDITMKNPLAGVGYNYQYFVLDSNRSLDNDLMGLESIIIKILIEQGFTGLFVFFYIFNLLRIYFLKKEKEEKNKILLNGYFISFLISILFTGIQGNSYGFFMYFLILINNCKYDTKNYSLLLVKQ